MDKLSASKETIAEYDFRWKNQIYPIMRKRREGMTQSTCITREEIDIS